MAGILTTATISSQINNYVQKKTLNRAIPNLVHSAYGLKNTIPTRNSKVMKFRRYERISPTTGKDASTIKSIVEGSTPSTTSPTITDVTVTLGQYGNLFQWSDQTSWINIEDVDQELMKLNGENLEQTSDIVYRDGILGGTNVFRLTDSVGAVAGSARVNVAGKINAVALDKAIRALKGADAKFYKDMIGASTKISTQAVRKSYIAIIHPDVEYDLESVTGYLPVSSYGEQSDIMNGEVGSYKNIRFVTSTLARIFIDAGATASGTKSTGSSNSDVYAGLIFGEEAFTCVDLASSTEVKYVPASSADHADPLGQFSTLGWKAMLGSLILNDAWILRFETVASA